MGKAVRDNEQDLYDEVVRLRARVDSLEYAAKALKRIDPHVESIGDGAWRSRAQQLAINVVHRAVEQLKKDRI